MGIRNVCFELFTVQKDLWDLRSTNAFNNQCKHTKQFYYYSPLKPPPKAHSQKNKFLYASRRGSRFCGVFRRLPHPHPPPRMPPLPPSTANQCPDDRPTVPPLSFLFRSLSLTLRQVLRTFVLGREGQGGVVYSCYSLLSLSTSCSSSDGAGRWRRLPAE